MTNPPEALPDLPPGSPPGSLFSPTGRHPLVPAALAFAAGTACAAWLPPHSLWIPAGLGLAALLIWGAALAGGRPAAAACSALLFFALLGAVRFADHRPGSIDAGDLAAEDATVEGRVAAPAEVREDSLVFDLDEVTIDEGEGSFRLRGLLQVFLRDFGKRPVPGERLLLRGELSPVRGDRNLTWFPRPVDPSRRRFTARLYVSSPLWVRSSGVTSVTGPALAVNGLRDKAVRFWDGDDRPAAALLKALTTGQRRAIPDDVRRAFYLSGLAHLLAVSGLHLGFIAVFLYFILRRMLAFIGPLVIRYPVQPCAAAATIPALVFVYLFTGQQISAGRAAIMAGLGLASVIFGRRTDLLNLVAFAALALLYADPLLLFSASFQLSFAAVTMLVLAAPRFPRLPEKHRRRWWHRPAMYFSTLVLTSLVAALATAPVAAFHFHRLSFAGPAANLAAVPLTCFLVLPLGWAAVAAHLIPGLPAGAIAEAAVRSGELLISIADLFARLPFSSVSVTRPPPFSVIALVALTAMLCVRRPPRRFAALLLAAAAASWVAAGTGGGMRMHFFDVGQGEACLVRLPGGETVLVDTGPAWRRGNAGLFTVSPALRTLGVSRIDILVLSHPHPDHAGGLASLLEEFPVDEIWSPPFDGTPCPPQTAAVLRRHEESGGKVRFLRRGDRINVRSGVRIDILNPPLLPYSGSGSTNDNSLVMLFSWRGCRLLTTGDIGPEPTFDIVGRLPEPGAHSVLKVPHHGGRQGGAASLASAFRPLWSVISVGRNRYGHPSPAVVEAYASEGRVLRTDRDGGIKIRCSGDGAEVRTWNEITLCRTMMERFRWFFRGF